MSVKNIISSYDEVENTVQYLLFNKMVKVTFSYDLSEKYAVVAFC